MNTRSESLMSELIRRGVLSSRELQQALGVSQPTLVRALSALGTRIVRIGRARSTRYGLRRDIRGLGSDWPLYRILDTGEPVLVGRLRAIAGGEWYLDGKFEIGMGTDFRDGLYPDLPWFLQDLRPRGFLGRAMARRYVSELGTPRDPRDWSSDDIFQFLLICGSDLPGAFVLGRRMLGAVQSGASRSSDVIEERDCERAFPARADAAIGGELPGSSAAGEQPKFVARVRGDAGTIRHVIVKFSGGAERPEDRRWADLLIAEHTANCVLLEAGIPCAETRILESGGRHFLESSRFDRTAIGGRRGLVSLKAFDNAYFGAIDTPWTDAAIRYQTAGWLSCDDADRLILLWLFGNLIGNTDMHYGNASLFLEQSQPLSLAPTYDMVPMLYRPDVEGNLPNRLIAHALPPPAVASFWPKALELAHIFWSRLACSEKVSLEFRKIAAQNFEGVPHSKTE